MTESLNDQQREVIKTDGHVLLTACPGSGKTRVLIHKIAHELNKIEESKKVIVALTFTNRAADEINGRIAKMDLDSEKLWTGTIHSFCLEWILKPYSPYREELRSGFAIADEYKSETLIATLRNKYDLQPSETFTTRRLASGEFEEIKHKNIVLEYHSILQSERLIDFDLMLYLSFAILDSHPKICKTLNNLFHFICVDEYQDTQELQYKILSMIISVPAGETKLFLVGDRDQAIYGSLGGVAKSLEEISVQFGKIEITPMQLSGNYRSTQRIIDFYKNFQANPLDIVSRSKEASAKGVVVFSRTVDKGQLSRTIASIIRASIENGIPEDDICVVSPQWWMVIPMGRKLKGLLPGLSFDAIGLSPLLKNKENVWFKLARLFLVQPSPNMYLTRVRWARELISEFEKSGVTILDSADGNAKSFLKMVNSVKSEKSDGLEYLQDCFEKVLKELSVELRGNSFLMTHWESFFEGAKRRLENPDFDYAKDIEGFRDVFRHKAGVTVNTCHGVKGEEFHTVIAFGLLQGYLPNRNEADAVDAARKLLYVICSRAKTQLYLISETGRTSRGRPLRPTELLQNVNFDYDDFNMA